MNLSLAGLVRIAMTADWGGDYYKVEETADGPVVSVSFHPAGQKTRYYPVNSEISGRDLAAKCSVLPLSEIRQQFQKNGLSAEQSSFVVREIFEIASQVYREWNCHTPFFPEHNNPFSVITPDDSVPFGIRTTSIEHYKEPTRAVADRMAMALTGYFNDCLKGFPDNLFAPVLPMPGLRAA